jgi:NitT/TauT family transport system permease protein
MSGTWNLESKSNQTIWNILSVLIFVVALAVSFFVPFAQNVKPAAYRAFLAVIIFTLITFYVLAVFFSPIKQKIYDKSQFIFGMGIALIIWDLLTAKFNILHLPFFPGPVHISEILVRDWKLLFISSLYSMRLFFTGLIVSSVLGIGIGILIGWNKRANYWISPIIKVTGVIPAVAWIPITVAIFTSNFLAGLFLIFISSCFSISFMTASGISSTPKSYFEVSRTLGADNRYLLFHVAIPNAIPQMFTGISIAVSFAFITLVVSEMIGAKAGLGWYINWAKGWSAYNKVYASIFIMAIVFSIILALVDAVRRRILCWQKGVLR